MEKEKYYFSKDEVGELLGVNPSTIERWAESGKLKCALTNNGKKFFSEDHLVEFAKTFNISTKFLETIRIEQKYQSRKKISANAGLK